MNKLVKGLLASLSLLCSVSAYAGFQSDSYDIYEANVDGKNGTDLVFIAKEKWVFVGSSVLSPIRFFDGKSFTLLNNGQGGYSISYSYHGSFNTNNYSTTNKYSVVDIDLNGDGKNDLLLKPSSGSIIQVYANTASQTAPASVVAQSSFAGISNDGLSISQITNIDGGPALLLSKNGVSWLVDGSGNPFNPTRSPSTANAVGSLKGDFTVSQGGAATYHLPIQLTPGPGQRKPNVSVSYDSQSGSGLLGMGWNLSATEQISRCQSKEPGSPGVTFTASDTLCLNGDELAYSHTSDSNKIYRKKIDDGTLVRITGTNADGPTKFKVYSEDGTVKEFGYTADSQTTKSGDVAIRKWYLNKVYWLGGASYSLKYSENESTGEVLLTQIDYGAHSVSFSYEERPDRRFGYQSGGARYGVTKRLKAITTKLNSNSVFNYTFFYGYNARKDSSYLTSIQQCAGGECLAPLAFNWNLPQNNFISSSPTVRSLVLEHDDHFTVGDVNGDGRSDLIVQETGYDGNNNNIKIYTGSSDAVAELNGAADIGIGTESATTDRSSLHITDIDTDGLSDIVWHYGDGIQNIVSNEAFSWADYSWTLATKDGQYVSFNDINGDGIDDLINYGSEGNIYTRAGKLGGGFGSQSSTLFSISMQAHAFGDINGDGKTDLVIYPTDKTKSSGSLGIKLGQGVPNVSANFTGFSSDTHDIGKPNEDFVNLSLMDVNGDGLSDLFVTIIREDKGYTLYDTHKTYYYLADGKGGFESNPVATFNFNRNLPQQFFDINGDGRVDRLVGNQYQLAGLDGVFGKSQPWGADLTPYIYSKTQDKDDDLTVRDHVYSVNAFYQDVNGDGESDMVVIKEKTRSPDLTSSTVDYTETTYDSVKVYTGLGGHLHIESIENSMDENLNIFYANMLDSNVYQSAIPTESDQGIGVSLSSKTWLVKETQSSEGQTYFKYGGAQYSKKDGYLGFQVFTSVTDRLTKDANNTSGRQAILSATYLHQSEYLAGKQYEVYKRVFDAPTSGTSAAYAVNANLTIERNSNGDLYASYGGRKLHDGVIEPYYDGVVAAKSGGEVSSTTDYSSTYDIEWEVRTLNNGIVRPVVKKESTTFFDPTHTSAQGDGHSIKTVTVTNSWVAVDQGRYLRKTSVVKSNGSTTARRTESNGSYLYLKDAAATLSDYHKLFLLTSFEKTITAGEGWLAELESNQLDSTYVVKTINGYSDIGLIEWTKKTYPSIAYDKQPPSTEYRYNPNTGDLIYKSTESVRSSVVYEHSSYTYDEETGFLLSTRDAENNAVVFSEHDAFGNPRVEQRQNMDGEKGSPAFVAYWLQIEKEYDRWGRLIKEVKPTGETVEISYNRCSSAFNGCHDDSEYRYVKSVSSNQGEEHHYFDERGLGNL